MSLCFYPFFNHIIFLVIPPKVHLKNIYVYLQHLACPELTCLIWFRNTSEWIYQRRYHLTGVTWLLFLYGFYKVGAKFPIHSPSQEAGTKFPLHKMSSIEVWEYSCEKNVTLLLNNQILVASIWYPFFF
jgi:hypothetical protein